MALCQKTSPCKRPWRGLRPPAPQQERPGDLPPVTGGIPQHLSRTVTLAMQRGGCLALGMLGIRPPGVLLLHNRIPALGQHLLRGRFVGEEKPCTGLDLLVHGHVQGMDRFRPSADVLIARVVVCEIGEFDCDIMREIWETMVEIPEHFPLLHAPPEHVACGLQMAQIGFKRGQEGCERGVLLKAE
jgi:hypothetical protein